ncbi:hypothetical protein C1645_739757 [Glomus cerebriforme]|uniref:Galactose oxidase n=1 Tax=Glomus cerebriforme TaxID=658196 RepID=A0A397SPJ0_9GLOM|nr:hypothetical protein C1645_739757 [Glomus cerebriforme]
MDILKILIHFIIFFQIIVNINCQPYVPAGRSHHTATLIGTRIFFLGGATNIINGKFQTSNDFFYLDVSRSFNKTKDKLPFVDLSVKAKDIPPHFGAAATVFGEPKDSIFLVDGDMGKFNDPYKIAFSFNSTQLEWKTITVFQGMIPTRKMIMNAVTDNNNTIYIFGGGFDGTNPAGIVEYLYSSEISTFDATNKVWNNRNSGLIGRDGHTATFLPDTGEIIYIGGINSGFGLSNITNLDVYNTINHTWRMQTTINPPEPRYGHTAVLTNDNRIVIFGGAQVTIEKPVKNRYVVLDTKTFEWYHGNEDPIIRAPFKHHTATLINDYMFIAFGIIDSINNQMFNNDILIYKIEDYANYSEVNNFIVENNNNAIISSTPSSDLDHNPKHSIAGAVIFGSILGIVIFGLVGFLTFRWYNKKRIDMEVIPTP